MNATMKRHKSMSPAGRPTDQHSWHTTGGLHFCYTFPAKYLLDALA